MRRSAWIFFASIFLPSLALAWLAVRSVQDQQVVLEHQQVIISQNITDALAKSVQARMDQVRADFVKTTQQLLDESASPEVLAQNFNRNIRDAWPSAQIGFAVNLDGQIYSPKPYDGPDARTFRDENDRFLSNRENVEVYASKSAALVQNSVSVPNEAPLPNASLQLTMKMPTAPPDAFNQKKIQSVDQLESRAKFAEKDESDSSLRREHQIMDLNAAKPAGPPAKSAANEGTTAAPASSPIGGAIRRSLILAPPPSEAAAVASSPAATPAAPESATGSSHATPKPQSADALETAAPAQAGSGTANFAPTIPAAPAPTSLAVSEPVASTASTTTATVPPLEKPLAPPTSTADDQVTKTNVASNSPPTSTGETSSMDNDVAGKISTATAQIFAKIQRNVVPQQMLARDTASLSNTVPAESDFRRVIGSETSGALARFLEDKLRLLVWSHPSGTPIVFGAQLDPDKLVETLKSSLQIPELAPDSYSRSSGSDVCVAILDDTGHPLVLSRPNFKGDWKHPFVATEIGEVLPHWEAALYLVDPGQISRAARTLRATLGLIVLLLVTAIVVGGSLIAADVRRQVRLAQQKTDFVSNVSHELKTPLTSIRMFADLLAEKRVPDEERQTTYLRIIAAEASRLTRLINNVLDFARLERGAKDASGEKRACDLVEAARDVIETCAPHLEAAGITFRHEIEAETLPIRGDRDALAQIILNLVSNAEKYGGNDVLLRVRRQETAAGALGCVDVLDRGAGIPARQVKTIFEPFHRLDDSLSSGIPGSGLGLTLARRMARAHGGDVTYSARAGGGSCFTLTVPLEAAA